MIYWSIKAAQMSNCFDAIWVSTDDEEILEIASECGAEIPFLRPEALSGDHATTVDVVRHAIDHAMSQKIDLTAVCCLYATAPFTRAGDLNTSYQLLKNVDWVIPVVSYSYPIQKALKILGNNNLTILDHNLYHSRSQDLTRFYHDAGQFYWAKPGAWKDERSPYEQRVHPMILPRTRVQDIDTQDDWNVAERLFHLELRDRREHSLE